MKKNNLLQFSLIALCATLTVSCSKDEASVPTPSTPTDTPSVPLQVHTGIELTKSAISGTDATKLGTIAVYANSTTQHNTTNNYAPYAWDNGRDAWHASPSPIQLTGETATIHAHYPAYQMGNNGEATETPLKPSSTPYTGESPISISIFEQDESTPANHTITPIDNQDTKDSNENENKNTLATALGDIDYMYANGTITATASSPEVTLPMKHALSVASFRAYAEKSYVGEGKLTQIVLKNSEGGSLLSKGTSPTMTLSGTVTPGNAAAATFTRSIGSNGETLVKATGTEANDLTAAKSASKKFSILVLPESTADKSTIQVVLTIDGIDYTTALPSSNAAWDQGKNYLYTLKLSGAGLSVTSVTITDWSTQVVSDDLEIK